jgi:hypothetical protein
MVRFRATLSLAQALLQGQQIQRLDLLGALFLFLFMMRLSFPSHDT